MGNNRYGDVVFWAVSMLEAGIESENLLVLASFSLEKLPNPWKVEDYFLRSFEDLGWTMPEPEESLRRYARDVCEDILSYAAPPIEGGHELYRVAVTLDYPPEMRFWFELDDGSDPYALVYLDKGELEKEIRHQARAFLNETRKESSWKRRKN